MFRMPSGPTAFFDVDDTLVMWNLLEDEKYDQVIIKCRGQVTMATVNTHNLELLKKLYNRGHGVVVWSAGGADWAEAVVIALGIEKYVHVVSAKPTYYIDDCSDPSSILGKHSYFSVDGERLGKGDHLRDRDIKIAGEKT